jgi:hypothetical protein
MKTLKIMMMALMMCFVNFSFAQDSIRVTHSGITTGSFHVNKSDDVIYSQIIEWVNVTYKNPQKVITGSVSGKSITISGFYNSAWCYKTLGMLNCYDLEYHIYIQIKDSKVFFNLVEDNYYYSGKRVLFDSKSFFKADGEYRKMYNIAKPTLESTINNLWFSLCQKMKENFVISSDEALTELKRQKDKLDLGLISQAQFDSVKIELTKFIK